MHIYIYIIYFCHLYTKSVCILPGAGPEIFYYIYIRVASVAPTPKMVCLVLCCINAAYF